MRLVPDCMGCCDCAQADAADADGLTPLHFAALLPNTSLALRLVSACSCSPLLWFSAAASDGLTPAHFAARCGRRELNIQMLHLVAQTSEVRLE